MPADVALRAVRLPEEEEFLFSVYEAFRRPEFGMLGWSDSELTAFLRMQFDAQTLHFTRAFPDGDNLLVLVGDEPAGRLLVSRSETEICIVDIGLLPDFRGLGVGGELVRLVAAEGNMLGLPVTCHVAQDNVARGFWEHLGFQARGLDGLHVAMERPCGPRAS
jgi:ribosomal protein S18 acetylase RimI-like enzyme